MEKKNNLEYIICFKIYQAVQEREKQYEPKLVLKPVQKPPSPPPNVPSPAPHSPSPKEPIIASPEQVKSKQNGTALPEESLSNHLSINDQPELPEQPQEEENSKGVFFFFLFLFLTPPS